MLEIVDDDVRIFGMLEEQDLLPSRFDTDQLVSWYDERDYYLVLFYAEGEDKGFVGFIIRDFACALADLQLLRDFLKHEQRLVDSLMLTTAYYYVASIHDVVNVFLPYWDEEASEEAS